MSNDQLKTIAGIVWCSGGMVLFLKGGSLLLQAHGLQPANPWTWAVVPAGLLLGGIKTVLIFEKACRKNLERIVALGRPRIWLAYRPGFYAFLAAMIVLGGTLSSLAIGNYSGLVALAVVDISLATALLGSSRGFWRGG